MSAKIDRRYYTEKELCEMFNITRDSIPVAQGKEHRLHADALRHYSLSRE